MSVPALLLFNGLLLWAAAWDVKAFRIPNAIAALLALSGIVLHAPATVGELLARLASVAVIGLVGGVIWSRRMIGGGDLKLLAACAVWIPFASLGAFATWVGWLGAFQGLATLALVRWNPLGICGSGAERASPQVPYAVSIAGGGLLWSLPRLIA